MAPWHQPSREAGSRLLSTLQVHCSQPLHAATIQAHDADCTSPVPGSTLQSRSCSTAAVPPQLLYEKVIVVFAVCIVAT